MGFRSFVIAGAVLTWAGFWAVPGAVLAAGANASITAPEITLSDQNGVELLSRSVSVSLPVVSIGNGDLSLSYAITPTLRSLPGQQFDPFFGFVVPTVPSVPSVALTPRTVVIGSASESFDSATLAKSKTGSTLKTETSGEFTYTTKDGTIYKTMLTFLPPSPDIPGYIPDVHFINSIKRPDGRTYDIVFESVDCLSGSCGQFSDVFSVKLISSIVTNFGLQLKYVYPNSNLDSSSGPIKVIAINRASEYCANTLTSCTLTQNWPTAQISWPTKPILFRCSLRSSYTDSVSATDSNGKTSSLTIDAIGRPVSYKRPESVIDTLSYQYSTTCSNNFLDSVVDSFINQVTGPGGTYSYSYTDYTPPNGTSDVGYSSTGPLGLSKTVRGPKSAAKTFTDNDGTIVTYLSNDARFISSITKPNGGTIAYTYDARGNITQTVETPIPSSGQSPRTVTAGYDTVCTYPAKCNQPNWIKDAQGNQTDFTYNNTTGQVLKVTGPAAPSGIRPQVRNTYTNRFAWFKNASGAFVKASSAISLLTKTSTCKTGAPATTGTGCAVAGDEIITTYEYGPDKGPNNLWLRGVVVDSGGLVLRTCYAYDAVGNRISQTSPRANLGSCP